MEPQSLFQRISAAIAQGEKWEKEHNAYCARKNIREKALETRISNLEARLDELRRIPKKERRGKWKPIETELLRAKDELRKLKKPWRERKSNFEAARRKERESIGSHKLKKLRARAPHINDV